MRNQELNHKELLNRVIQLEKENQELQIDFKNKYKELELNNQRLDGLLRISQFYANTIQELLDYALFEAIRLTYSKIGYIFL